MDCNGECKKQNECAGTVRNVEVSGNGWISPFQFQYCETAIETDRSRGFTVLVEGEDFDEHGLGEADYYTGITQYG